MFLGCTFADGDEEAVREAGALVFPAVPGSPVDSYRGLPSTPHELYAGLEHGYDATLDARAYAWSRQRFDVDATLAQALHDHAVDDALAEWVTGRDLVGVMGGHAVARGTAGYAEAARLGHRLGGFLTVATGGGPGAMEAAALGARMADASTADLEEALAVLAGTPSFTPSVGAWVEAGMTVLRRWPEGRDGLGVPTWFYGHEPPAVFASAIAKFFANPLREARLLEVCRAGIVFLPGAAGTVQEVFTDACENYYAEDDALAPMVLLGVEQWTERLPAWPLLAALADAAGDRMRERVHLVDSLDEAAEILGGPTGVGRRRG